MRPKRRTKSLRAAGAVVWVLLVTGCTDGPPRSPVTTTATATHPGPVGGPTAAPPGPAAQLLGDPLDGPTGLRLLVEGVWYDLDAGTSRTTAVSSWLRPVTGPPILLIEPGPPTQPQPGQVAVARVGAGTPPTLRVTTTADRYRLAPSVDGRGVWVSVYRSRTSCVLRELTLDGRTRRASRTVPCGVEPLLETPAGLWVSRWVNVYTLAGRTVHFTEPTYALLDPRTLQERATYTEAFVVGAHHVLTMDDHEAELVLRDVRTGAARPLAKPSQLELHVFNSEFPVARVSPDGRYALFRLGDHGQSPQVIDLWVLDLTAGAWQHVPGFPVQGALKYASEAWAPDGRLVMLGQYGERDPVLATWRPGDPRVAVRPDRLPETVYDGGLQRLFVAATADRVPGDLGARASRAQPRRAAPQP